MNGAKRVFYKFALIACDEPMLPSPDILNNYEHGKFVLANLAAKRAKQLREGAPPLVSIDSNHPLTIALAEIAAGKIKAILPEAIVTSDLDDAELQIPTGEVLPAEFGMLLPALDESEVALIEQVVAEDHEDHSEDEISEVVSLSDLVSDEEEEVAPAVSEDDTLSLSDIAEQETAGDDDETAE
jgi:DNA-directed RNA polymerase subunit omega